MLAARCCGATARAAASAGLVPLQSHLAAASSYYLPSSSCVSPASALAPVAVALSSRRGFHGSSAALAFRKVRQQPGMIANTFFYPPSTEGAAAAILEARRQIFGHVPGDGTRSGRKAFRQKLKGQALKDWYHLRIEDLPLHEVGIENPAREELYRKEEELNRIGKTRIKGKVRGPTPDFVREMKLKDAEEEIMEPIDCFLPEDALPEDESVEKLVEELDLDEVSNSTDYEAGANMSCILRRLRTLADRLSPLRVHAARPMACRMCAAQIDAASSLLSCIPPSACLPCCTVLVRAGGAGVAGCHGGQRDYRRC